MDKINPKTLNRSINRDKKEARKKPLTQLTTAKRLAARAALEGK